MNNWKLKFALIWSGQAVSFFTSAILQMALIWHLAIVTSSALILSVASIAGFLPMALLGSFAGALVDRWNRKATMIGADLFIAAVSASLCVYCEAYGLIPRSLLRLKKRL
jgi:DHA3 family macrolide efflux protein-like MFS transporter